MGVRYRRLNFSSRDHEMVSGEWFVLLWDITHHDHLVYNVNEGHRTMARQAELVEEKGLWSESNPTGAAKPSKTAPHIRTGHPDHAIDFDNASGVREKARKRGVTINFPLSREPWHGEADPHELYQYYKKNWKRVWREAGFTKVKKVVKKKVGVPTRASDQLVGFLASWEGERLEAYKVKGEDFFTIGVGHTGEVDGKPIHAGQYITRMKSRKLLHGDLMAAEAAVERLVPLRWRRRQRRYDTMVSLVFNMGPEILTATAPLTSFGVVLKKAVRTATINEAASAITLYNKGGSPLHVMDGLKLRRQAEAQMFKYGKYVHNH